MPDINMTNRVIQIHLSSWRYIAALTLPPLVLAFNLLYSNASVALLILFMMTHYYCWRLWLDERLFQLLHDESTLSAFDEGMACFWRHRSGETRPIDQRWRGAKGLFHRAMFTLILLWLVSLCSILYTLNNANVTF